MIARKYSNWVRLQQCWNDYLKIPEVISERVENNYKFCKQQEAKAECWEKKQKDQPQPKNCIGNDTISTTEINNNKNNNNKTNDNPTKVNDNHLPEPSSYLLKQQKVAATVECWKKVKIEESGRQRQLKRQQLECERQRVERDQQYRQ